MSNCSWGRNGEQWRWQEGQDARMTTIDDNNSDNNNNGHQHLPDGNQTTMKMKMMTVEPQWDNEDHDDK